MSFDDDADDEPSVVGPPPHPDDRLWRHPSEMAGQPRRPALAPSPARAEGGLLPWGLLAAGFTAAVAIVAGLGVAVMSMGDADSPGTTAGHDLAAPPQPPPPVVDEATLRASRNAVAPTVVAIRHAPTATAPGDPTGGGPTGSGPTGGPGGGAAGDRAAGSGLIVRPEGIVVTSLDLVGDGAATVDVRLADGRAEVAHVVGVDPVTGLAVLDLTGDGYPTAARAEPAQLSAGAVAITVGAGGTGGAEATGGRVGANRRLTGGDGTVLEGLVAVEGGAAPGALGGPVVAPGGAVMGVTTALAGDTATFSTPVDVVAKVTDDLVGLGRARHSWLGIDGLDDSGADNPGLGLWGGDDVGVVVSSVAVGGPGAMAGLRASDVIVAVDGQQVASMPDLVRWLRPRSPGDVVQLTVERAGAETVIAVTLGELAG